MSICTKNIPNIFVGIVLNIYIDLKELTSLLCCLLIHEHGISLHLFRSLFLFFQLGNSLRTVNCGSGGAHILRSYSQRSMFFFRFRREDKSDPCYSILDRRESLQVISTSPGIFIFKLYANEKIKQTSKTFFKQVG